MTDSIHRRTVLGGSIGALGAAAVRTWASPAEGPAAGQASGTPDAACWARPLAQDYTVIFENADGGRGFDGGGLVKTPSGMLVAVLPVSPGGKGWRCLIVQSTDGGRNWSQPVAELPYKDAVLWQHQATLYLFAFTAWGGNMLLLRSTDAGATWSEPVTLFEGRFWNCQTGMVERDNRLYWAIDEFPGRDHRGPRAVVGDLSGDVMDPKAWRLSNHVPHPGLPDSLVHPDKSGTQRRMLEPNVIDVNGNLRLLVCVKAVLQATTNLCAVFDVADEGQRVELSFTQFHPMPGGQVKFFVSWDEVSRMFWATVNLAADGQDAFALKDPREHRGGGPYHGAVGGNDRRFLMLMYGLDGLNWFPAGCVARAGRLSQSFMYPSHLVDGDDLLVIARSSVNGDNRHDADMATFHRVRDFRRLAMNLRQDIDS